MGKLWVEVCLISGRGLRRASLWKLQWFAVGWVDPNNKYCTRIDASGNANPVWKTKFSTLVDQSESNFKDLTLHVEIYSREPIFLGERLQGTATVVLKEFLDKYIKNSEVSKPVEEVGSFQLRKSNSNKCQGFVDISIRISQEREEHSSFPGNGEGFELADHSNGIELSNYEHGSTQVAVAPCLPAEQPSLTNFSYAHPLPHPSRYNSNVVGGSSYRPPAGGPNYRPPRTPPPPPPPANVGYIPTFLPRSNNLPPSYINMPSSSGGGSNAARPGFGMGLGAGALAAGAVIFGDDFMSGFDFPGGLQDDTSVTVSMDPPF